MGRLSEINPWDDDPSITKGAFIDSASKRMTQQVSGREKIKKKTKMRKDCFIGGFLSARQGVYTHIHNV